MPVDSLPQCYVSNKYLIIVKPCSLQTGTVPCTLSRLRGLSWYFVPRPCPHPLCFYFDCKQRGLQLHLLSALGEIWRGGNLPQDDGSKKEFVGLSVVMAVKRKGEAQQVDVDSRRLLEDSGEVCLAP